MKSQIENAASNKCLKEKKKKKKKKFIHLYIKLNKLFEICISNLLTKCKLELKFMV